MDEPSAFVNYYQTHNLHLIRIAATGHDAGKRPLDRGWQHTPVPYDDADAWSRAGRNLGWCVGPDHLVIDVDPRNGGQDGANALLELMGITRYELLETTPVVATGGGGEHWYFSRPAEAEIKNGPMSSIDPRYTGIDAKTGASQVVIAGSTHPSGLKYWPVPSSTWPSAPSPAPEKLITLLRSPQMAPRAAASPKQGGNQWSTVYSDSTAAQIGALTINECAGLLATIDPAELSDYDMWIRRLAAIHHATGGDGLELAIEWSARDPRYAADAEREVRRRWPTFDSPHPHPATVGTLLHDAETLGGEPGRLAAARVRHKMAAAQFSEIEQKIDHVSPGAPGYEVESIVRDIVELGDVTFEARMKKQLATDLGIPQRQIDPIFNEQRREVKKSKKEKDKKPPVAAIIQEAADLTVTALRDTGRYITRAPNGQYYIYTAGQWSKVGEEHVRSLSLVALNKTLKAHGIDTIERSSAVSKTEALIRSEVYTTSQELYYKDESKCLINLKNGTIHIDQKTGEHEIKPHNPADYLTTQIPVEYSPGVDCPAFSTMLWQVFAHIPLEQLDAVIRHFWELIGYAMQPTKDIPLIMFWYGSGYNGKTTIADFLARLIGQDGVLPAKIHEFGNGGNNHASASLEGKLLLIDDDMQSDARLSDGLLKKYSETKQIEINPKNKPTYNIRCNVTPLLLTNGMPIIRDLSKGLKRRMDVLPFLTDLTPHRKSELPQIAKSDEMPGILNHALDGLRRMRARGHFDPPPYLQEEKSKFFRETNNVAAFLEFGCKTVEGKKSPSAELYSDYVQFCARCGERYPEAFRRFRELLGQAGIEIDYRSVKGIESIKGIEFEDEMKG